MFSFPITNWICKYCHFGSCGSSAKKLVLTVRKDLKQGLLQRTSGSLLFLEHRMRKGIKGKLMLPGAGTEEWYAINRFGFFCRGNQQGLSEKKCNYQQVLSKQG